MIVSAALFLAASLRGAPLLLAPVWLVDIEKRAEEAAAGREVSLTEEDLRTIKRKLDFDEAEPSLSLTHLRRFIGESIARHEAEPSLQALSGCLLESFSATQ